MVTINGKFFGLVIRISPSGIWPVEAWETEDGIYLPGVDPGTFEILCPD